MTNRKTLGSKLLVFLLAFAVVFTYSVIPMNQAYAATKKPGKAVISKLTAVSSSSIKVTWKKAKNAKKYQIYVSTKSKKGFKLAATVKSSKRSYTVKKYNKKALKANTKYYFKVRAINGKKKGSFSKVKYLKTKKAAKVVEKDATLGELNKRTMTITIDMSDAERYPAGKEVEVWVPVPWEGDVEPYQTVTGHDIKADKAEVKEFKTEKNSGWDNKMAYIKWGKDTAPADRIATISFDVERYAVSRPDAKEDTSAAVSAEAKKFLGKTGRIDPEAEIVKEYAKIAAGDGKTNLEKAENIYNWIIDNLERLDIGDDIGTTTFTNDTGCGKGDPADLLTNFKKYGRWGGHCTDLNSCFVALCRASGVPAREMFGIRMPEDASGGQHCWAEFYVPGEGWTAADPGDVLKAARGETADRSKEAIDAARKSDKVATAKKELWLGVDNNRVVLSRGRDVVLEPAQKGGPRNTFGYPYAEVDGVQKDAKGDVIDCTKGGEFKYTIKCTDIAAKTITAAELNKVGVYKESSESGYKVLDVRRAASYGEAHIPGSVSADVDGAVQGTDAAAAKANVEAAIAGDPDDMKYVLVCYSGNKYANAARNILLELGKKNGNILILAQDDGTQGANGGMNAWKGALVNPKDKTVTLKAVMNDTIHMGDHAADVTHHVVVNKEGSNAPAAAMTTEALAGQVYRGLIEIGAAPGNKFTEKCPAESIVEGDPINISFTWEGGEAGMTDLFKLVTKEENGAAVTEPYVAQMTFGGNVANLDKFDGDYNQTGCITCTFSCWIGTVSNSAYGYSTNEAFVNREVAPAPGTEITVTYSAGK